MSTTDTFVMPEFPGHEATLALVRERVHECGERRLQRLVTVGDLSQRRFTEALDALRVRMAFSARQKPEERGSAFAPLAEHDLALLDRAVVRYETTGRLRTLHEHPRIQVLLGILRVNYAAGQPVVSGAHFREIARELFREAVPYALSARALSFQRPDDPHARNIVVLLPWRAALIAGEVYRSMGTEDFWHLGACRNEQTLATEIYHESAPPTHVHHRPQRGSDPTHHICDPMLATGGTTITAVERLLAAGVRERHIVVHSVVAAPEGVDLLLHTYPDLRIVTCALDEKLDRNGYIAGPGLGDFGDLAFSDIDTLYAEVHWVTPGLLTDEQAAIILDRMRTARS